SGRTADRSTQALPPVRRAPELPPADEGETPPAAGDGTMTIRAVGQGGGAAPTTGQGQGQGRNQAPGRDDGTMAIRAIGRRGSRKGAGAAP
ncbi:hypothetical protein GTZ78_58755, partial [Streptomyces sp. SID8361]|nr:hypothetical protein [Streptomyces sp. SID8361]